MAPDHRMRLQPGLIGSSDAASFHGKEISAHAPAREQVTWMIAFVSLGCVFRALMAAGVLMLSSSTLRRSACRFTSFITGRAPFINTDGGAHWSPVALPQP